MGTCSNCGADLPPDARFCPACAAPVEAPAPSEERKLATVLFADLVGSTELGEQDPERTRALLDRFYDAMAAEIAAADGTVEKFAGDAVMAAFGVPAAHEDHAERALHTGLSMLRRLEELFADKLSLRIGVNTGEVVAGRPREGSSFVTGDAVNVAARLEQAAAPGEILVGERTVAAARGAFEFGEPATVEAKGKPAGVECRRLVRALTLMRPRGVGGLRRTFVGRTSELELLEATYRRVAEQREPHLVTIMGEAGVGKTRLVRELWERLGNESPEPVRRTGRCLPYGHGITYWPLGEVLKEHLGILENDPPAEVAKRLGAREILGLTIGLELGEELHPLAARDRLHDGWVSFLEELSGNAPGVVLIEDLHWAEEPLLDLVERLLRDVRGPLFLLGTARPELLDRRSAWGGGRRNASLLWLDALSAGDATRMLDELVAADLPVSLRDVIVGRAEGNPFFVEELIGSLIDRGLLARVDGGWSVEALPEDFDVPDSVQAVLAARIDLLGPAEKAALQAGSVIGRVFWAEPVRELLDGADADFDLLEERDFIRRRPGSAMAGDREFAIKHSLTREVAYGTVPKAKRARLHAAFADWLERTGEGRDEHAPLLAHHYAEAARPEDADLAWPGEDERLEQLRGRAAAWLSRAGVVAVSLYELEEALELLHRALEFEADAERRSALWREIGVANVLKFDGEPFWTAMEKSLETCTSRATRADIYSLLAFQTSIRSGMWKRRPDDALVDGWIEQALELAEPGTPALTRALLARYYWHQEDSEDARHASALAEQLGDAELRSYAWAARATAAFHQRQFDEASMWSQRRFDLVEISDPDHVVELRETAMPASAALGRFREARRFAREHVELSSGLTPHHRLHGVALTVEVEELAGNWEELRALETRIEQAVQESVDTPCIRGPRSLLLCAVASAYAGDHVHSRELERAADDLGAEGHSWALDSPRTRLALARRDLNEVSRLAENRFRLGMTFGLAGIASRLDALAALSARAEVEDEAPPFLRPRTYLEPFAARALGVVREDDELIRRALEQFEAMKLDWHAEQTRALLDGG